MEITIPYNYRPREYQLDFLRAPQRFKVGAWHRRSGKSKTALNEQVRKSQLRRGVYYYILPTYRQAKQVIWDSLLKEHVPFELVNKVNDSELAVYWRNGSIQRFVGCEDIDRHRGIDPIDVVFDEYAETDEKMWAVIIQPVLRENKGTATFMFTPKGQNHAWRLLQYAKDHPEEWFWSLKTVEDTKAIDRAELEAARSSTPEAFFRQEYYCEFLAEASRVFRRIRDNVWSGDLFVESGRPFVLGVDLAKYQDWTVLTPFDLYSFKAGKQERFHQVDWNLQKAKIEAMARRFNNAKVRIDSTGVGDPIYEDLDRIYGNAEPFRFTEESRENLLNNLAILLEQDKIKIPDDEGLIAELEAARYELTSRGRTRITWPEGITNDRVMSLALAVWGASEPVGTAEVFTPVVQTW